uniref:Integrase n=1 Tax=Globodera pallida TaxID=36090 RepID=A0A183CEP3_GLOPA
MGNQLIRNFLYNEQLIRKMADSAPIRRTARLLIRSLFSAQSIIQKAELPTTKRVNRFLSILREEYRKAIGEK